MIPFLQCPESGFSLFRPLRLRISQQILKAHLPVIILREVVDAHADKAHRPVLHLAEEFLPLFIDDDSVVAGLLQQTGAGDLLHVRVGDLQHHALSHEAYPFCPVLHAQGQQEQHIVQHRRRHHILLEGDLPADGLGVLRTVGFHGAVVLSRSEVHHPPALFSEQADDVLLPLGDLLHGADAVEMQFLRGLGSHGVQFPHVAVPHEGHEILRRGDLEIPVGLLLLAGGLGGGLGIGHPHAAGQMHLIPGALLDEPGDAPGPLQILCLLRHVQIRLVQSDVLGGGGIGVPDLMELMGDGPVFIEIGMHEDAVGALPVGILDVHAGADAVFPRLVAAGGHHAPFRGKGADDQRLAPEGRVVPHFHRRVERVHIHMDDDTVHLPTSPFFSRSIIPHHPPGEQPRKTKKRRRCVLRHTPPSVWGRELSQAVRRKRRTAGEVRYSSRGPVPGATGTRRPLPLRSWRRWGRSSDPDCAYGQTPSLFPDRNRNRASRRSC